MSAATRRAVRGTGCRLVIHQAPHEAGVDIWLDPAAVGRVGICIATGFTKKDALAAARTELKRALSAVAKLLAEAE